MLSLKTLPQAKAQEVFDHIVKHLLTQKQRAFNRHAECRYRIGELRCAAGCLIADNEYTKSFEGYGWDDLVEKGDVPEKHRELILELQLIHDNSSPANWYEMLYALAGSRRLNRKALREYHDR